MSGYYEPWSISDESPRHVESAAGDTVGTFDSQEAAERTLECVNAMQGMHINDTSAATVKELHEAAREFFVANLAHLKTQSAINQNLAKLAARRLERALARFGVTP